MVDTLDQTIVQNEQYSVRQFSPSTWGGFIGDSLGFLWPAANRDLIAAWGTRECDVALRVLHYTQQNALWGGAVNVWIEKVIGTPYEISGGRNLTMQWQDIFFETDFGEGYDFMLSKFLTDYLTLNRGGFIELVTKGDPSTPIQEGARILGLNHLDALRIIFTGNLEWPYLYQSEWTGQLHKMHTSRVLHLSHHPSPNTSMFGMGKSCLFDALSTAYGQIRMGRHKNELLSDLPPPGIVLFNNVKADEVETAMRQFDYERIRDGENIYRAPLQLSSLNPAQPASVTFVPLSTVPEGYDPKAFMETDVNLMALVLQLDPQDIWPLQSAALGSGQQSYILNQKSRAKGPYYMTTRLERMWNQRALPVSLKFINKAPNAEADREVAESAASWVDTANKATFMTPDEKRQLVANQVPAFEDVLTDELGQLRLYDVDPKTPEQIIAAGDIVETDTPLDLPETTGNSETTDTMTDADLEDTPADEEQVAKDIDATGAAFISDVQAAIEDGIDRVTTKAGMASRVRGAIVRYGKKAFQDGLEDGGVDKDALDEDDLRTIADDNVADSVYVSNLANEVYSEAGLVGTAQERAALWISSLNRFYYHGIDSADKNGMYKFVGDDGVENCRTCKALKGQVHRMKDWMRKQLVPGLDHDNFECGTWEPNCAHYLEKTTDKAQGNWV